MYFRIIHSTPNPLLDQPHAKSETHKDCTDALVNSALPTILVSCKCDNPVNTRQIDTDSIEAVCLAEVETVKTAANVPESARLCLGAMLRAIMAHRNGWCILGFVRRFFKHVDHRVIFYVILYYHDFISFTLGGGW